MPHLSEKNYRRLQTDAENGRKLQKIFGDKAKQIVTLVAGGIRRYEITKPEGVTDEQHQEYLDQISLLSATLDSMPLSEEK